MRVRSVVLPAVLAVAAAVLAPTSAQAATVQCGAIIPTKIVADGPVIGLDVTLTTGCARPEPAQHAKWDLIQRSTGAYTPVEFDSAEIAESRYWTVEWEDDNPVGRWTLTPQELGAVSADGQELSQNTAVTTIKYGSRLDTKVTRTGSKLSWAVTATQWSGRAQKDVARPKASVGLFHQAPGSTTWTYVKSVTTTSTGKATVSLAAPKAGSYRLKVAETPTVWAAYSKTVQGRR